MLQDANNLGACTDEQERRHLAYMLEACKERKSMYDSSLPASDLDSQLQEMCVFRRRQAVSSINRWMLRGKILSKIGICMNLRSAKRRSVCI